MNNVIGKIDRFSGIGSPNIKERYVFIWCTDTARLCKWLTLVSQLHPFQKIILALHSPPGSRRFCPSGSRRLVWKPKLMKNMRCLDRRNLCPFELNELDRNWHIDYDKSHRTCLLCLLSFFAISNCASAKQCKPQQDPRLRSTWNLCILCRFPIPLLQGDCGSGLTG